MKKFMTVLLSLFVLCGALTGCGDKNDKVQVYMPDGAPAVSMAKLIADGYDNTEFNVVTPTDIASYVASGTADIAIVPTNAAANLSSKGANIAMVAVTNFGSLYLIGNGEPVAELSELKGKVVYSIGKGNVPDLVFRILLDAADIEYKFSDTATAGVVSLAYVSEGNEFIGGMNAGKMAYGVVSEPAATIAQGKVENCVCMFDIQSLYASLVGGEGFPQAALVVNTSFLENNREYVRQFVETFKESVKWAETNPAEALAAIKSAGSTAVATLNEKIAKGCNLGFTWAAETKDNLVEFYNRLKAVAKEGETPVGSSLPADGFYLGSI